MLAAHSGMLPRVLGALALLAVGAIHLEQLIVAAFWYIPVIGPLFALNVAGSVIVGFALLVPLRLAIPRWEPIVSRLLAGLGVALAAVGLALLVVSESVPVFGFKESGYRPEVIVALVADAAAIVLLVGFLVVTPTRRMSVRPPAAFPPDHGALGRG